MTVFVDRCQYFSYNSFSVSQHKFVFKKRIASFFKLAMWYTCTRNGADYIFSISRRMHMGCFSSCLCLFLPRLFKFLLTFTLRCPSFTALLCDKDNPHNKLSCSPEFGKISYSFPEISDYIFHSIFEGKSLLITLEAGKAKWQRKKKKAQSTEYSLAGCLQVLAAVLKMIFLLNSTK